MRAPQTRCIIIAAMGTRGDVQPFVALGLHLRARGWRVVLAAPPEFRAFTTSYGLEHEDIGISLQVSSRLSGGMILCRSAELERQG